MNPPTPSSRSLRKPLLLTAALLLPALFPSCLALSLGEQKHLQQPGMKFAERGALASGCVLPGHVERGRALSSGTAGGGCSSCH